MGIGESSVKRDPCLASAPWQRDEHRQTPMARARPSSHPHPAAEPNNPLFPSQNKHFINIHLLK